VCKLKTDDGVVDELLAKGLALVCVFDRFFVADSGEADGLNDDTDTFVARNEG